MITVGKLGRLRSLEQRGSDVVFSFDSSDLIVTPLMPSVLRHTWVPRHWRLYTESVKEGYAVRRRFWPAGPRASIEEHADCVRVRVGEVLLEANRDPFRLRYFNRDGELFLEEIDGGGLSWSYWDYSLSYRLADTDHFYGLGQANQLEEVRLDARGALHEIWNQHSPPSATIFPSLMSLRGYGLLVDNPSRAQWDLGRNDPLSFSYRARGGGLQYYVFYGPELRRLIRTFCELTGFPPMPPRWVFGLLQSRYGYRSRHELEEIARTFRQKELPCDALILDVFWFREMGDLAFDPVDWPGAREMIARLKHDGFRTLVIEEPYLTTRSRNYAQAHSNGYLARHYDGSPYTFDFWPGECALFDFSNPAARLWWAEKHRPLIELGIDGWWTDLNEPAKHFQDMSHYGGPAASVHNVMALWMQSAVHDAHLRYASERRVFILSRSAFPGSQRYGTALWSGDVDMTFASLRKQIPLGLNVGLAGIPVWGTDIGGFGFGGKCTPELYVRWFQFGVFSPLCRPHGDQRELREPWQFGAEVEAICRKYLQLRYRLLPYIYSAAREACIAGIPIMRPLVLDYPDDPRVHNLSDQYLFGPEILVAPIIEAGATERQVYLPAGTWFDFWTDTPLRGGCTVAVHAELETIPLFIREGAMIPLGPDVQYSSQRRLDPLTLELYRGADRTITLFEDDGETTAYQNGAYAETCFAMHRQDGELLCELGASRGNYPGFQAERAIFLNVHAQDAVRFVECDGVRMNQLGPTSRAAPENGWRWDPKRRLLSIRLERSASARSLRIS